MKKKFSEETIPNYKLDYMQWKSWCQNFAAPSKTELQGFASEISKLSIPPPPLEANVLEIGFGNGSFLRYAQNQKWKVTGTEVNEELVRIGLDSGYDVLKAENLSQFGDSTFDLVVAFDVLEHLNHESLIQLFVDVKRVLKNNGSFIARFPNGDSPFGLLNQNSDITHLTSIGSGKIKYLTNYSKLSLHYIGGESQPIIGVSALHFCHRLFSEPLKKIINTLMNPIFYPGKKVSFCSLNLVIICVCNKE